VVLSGKPEVHKKFKISHIDSSDDDDLSIDEKKGRTARYHFLIEIFGKNRIFSNFD